MHLVSRRLHGQSWRDRLPPTVCRPHWRSARTWPPDETLQQTLYLAEPAAHVEDAVNSIRVARKRSSPGPEAARQQVWGLPLGYWHAMLCVRVQQPPSATLTGKHHFYICFDIVFRRFA